MSILKDTLYNNIYFCHFPTVNVLKARVSIKLTLFLIIILFSYESKYFDGRQDILLFSFNLFIFRFLYEIFINKQEVKKISY